MKYTFLALLAPQSAHGYEIKQSFDSLFGSVRSLNMGQIYTTLGRLERDNLVSSEEIEQHDRPNKRVYEITETGQQAVAKWLHEPSTNSRLKDEFVTKLLLAEYASIGDQVEMIRNQRFTIMNTLRQFQKASLDPTNNKIHPLMLEGGILHLQADLKWLDACEQYYLENKT